MAARVGAHQLQQVPQHRYCIVGAGFGGLQLGQFLLHAGRDYVIFEEKTRPASFYERFPIHRRLISINKRFTGRTDPTFNLRHDWNSLLDTTVQPMTNRTEERFPHADTLVEYAREFAREQEQAGRIQYSTEVLQIEREEKEGDEDGSPYFPFHLQVRKQVPGGTMRMLAVECKLVVVAHGLHSPTSPAGWGDTAPDGRPLVEGYEVLPSTGRRFENRSVAVFGLGNAAFETADAVAPFAQYVHVFRGGNTPPSTRPLVAWESRYVGNVRAVNAQLLDSYLLKSLDGGFAEYGPNAKTSVVLPCGEGRKKRCLLLTKPAVIEKTGEQIRVLNLPAFDVSSVEDAEFMRSLGSPVQVKSPVYTGRSTVHMPAIPLCSVVNKGTHNAQNQVCAEVQDDTTPEFAVNNSIGAQLLVMLSAINDSNIDQFVEFSRRQGGQYPLVYDDVIRCLGWSANLSMYAASSKPLMQANGKYAVMNAGWESVNVPGLFFAGAAAHGRDYKRSAGGFIHGFRYTARALFGVLSQRFEAADRVQQLDVVPANHFWPRMRSFDLRQGSDAELQKLEDYIFSRIDTADGPYQMVAVLGDGLVLRCAEPKAKGKGKGERRGQAKPGGIKIDYYEEVPLAHFNQEHEDSPRFTWSFGYAQQSRSLSDSVKSGTLFEVFLYFFAGKGLPHTAATGDGDWKYGLYTTVLQMDV